MNDRCRRVVRLARARPGLSGAVALFVLLVLVYCTSIDIRASRGASITGDEPFYLITTQSLLQDGDLDLRNQYATRSYESLFDHPDGLWTQSVPLADGRVLSPHNVGLSLLVLPGFAIDGLVGVQVQLVLIAALTWALAYVLALRLSGARPWLVWLATLAVALSATAFIYSSEVYPDGAPSRRVAPYWSWAGRSPRSAMPRPPRDVRVADAVQRQSRLPGRFDGQHRRRARRGRRSALPAVGAADRPALRRRALGARAARRRAGGGAAGARRHEAQPRVGPRRGAGADRDIRRDHDDGLVVPRPHAGRSRLFSSPRGAGGCGGRRSWRSASTRSP